jgi:DNA-binding NarL/FixJ family response regulator
MKQTRLLIVDDHEIVRKGIQMFLNTAPSIHIVGEAESGWDAVRKAKELQPDVILMDLVMPQGDGIEAIAELRRSPSQVKIVVLTTFGDEARVIAAVKAGANGYLLKDANGETLLQAIQAVQRGGMPLHPSVTRYLLKDVSPPQSNGHTHLTEREKEILKLVTRGLSNKEIAQILKLSDGTVKVHVSNILSKLNVASRTEAATWALQMGLVSLEEPVPLS